MVQQANYLNSDLLLKYKEFSKQQLKWELEPLKHITSEDVNTIECVSKL